MPMMEKQKRLVNVLLMKTKRGELEWREAISGEAFQVALSNKVVRIKTAPNPRSQDEDYWIEFANEDGKVVDSFSDVELYKDDGGAGTNIWFPTMRDLYELARRTALGSEQILNELLSELGDDEMPL